MVVVPRHDGGPGPEDGQAPAVGPSILVIDRQLLFGAALETLLMSPPVNATVEYAHDTDAGLAMAMSGRFQLVFCEVRAQPVAAVELADRLAERTPKVPVILLGDPDEEQLLAAALNTSVAGMFTKDASLEEFLVGVKAVLAGHRAVGSSLMGKVIARLDEGAAPRRTVSQLSPTELDILTMIGEAKSIPAIAASRGISHKTVRNHLANIYRKLELRSRTEAMLCAARMGLTSS